MSTGGPREIAQVAEALNDMRKRVRSLVDERTQMLAAISHDLRTPLTRLRLRVERLNDGPPRAAMLQDIVTINEMLGETPGLCPPGALGAEEASLIDFSAEPSLETIAAQFADIGPEVSYSGPDRLSFRRSRVQAIGRAACCTSSRMRPSLARALSLSCAHSTTAVSRRRFSTTAPVLRLGFDRVFGAVFQGRQRLLHRRSHRLWPRSFDRPHIADRHGKDIALVNRSPTASAFVKDLQTPAAHPGLGVTSAA